MFNYNSRISRQDRVWERDCFNDLVTQFGDDFGPRHSDILIPENGFLSAFPQRNTFQNDNEYVQAFMLDLQNRLKMQRYPIQTAGLERHQPKLNEHRELQMPGHCDADERYYTDIYGQPVAYYEPSRLGEPLYLLCRISQVLTDIVHMAASAPSNVLPKTYQERSELIASFLGLGPVFALTKPYRNKVQCEKSGKSGTGVFLRGTLLFLHHKGCSAETITTDYAQRLTQIFGPSFGKDLSKYKNWIQNKTLGVAPVSDTPPAEHSRPHPIPA